ncbi:MAG: 16S rRNA (uracil(1498)-N(3))-methyltransferase [Pseudomonadota bacterium]
MRMTRLFIPQPFASGSRIELDHDSAHYVRTVLRLKAGASVVLFNGEGGEYSAILLEVSRKTVSAEIGPWNGREAESPLRVEVGLAISRGERMDFAVQKAVELGVCAITPLMTERVVVQLKGDRRGQKRAHWQRVAQSAAEQCGRNVVPPVGEPAELADWLSLGKGLRLFLDPHSENNLRQLIPGDEGHITLLAGPEGGFSGHERAMAVSAGFTSVRLGPRILRAETAALAALAAVQSLWGDFSG